METLFLSNWQHEKNGERLNNPSRMEDGLGSDEVTKKGDIEGKRNDDMMRKKRASELKRRRERGGKVGSAGRGLVGDEEAYVLFSLMGWLGLRVCDRARKRAMLMAQSAFAGGDAVLGEDEQIQWAIGESYVYHLSCTEITTARTPGWSALAPKILPRLETFQQWSQMQGRIFSQM